ncbi:hypothetical protein ACWDFR_13795 [Streptomyces sp. 900105755]
MTAASTKYSYAVNSGTPSVVTTQSLADDGSYRTATVIYDALLRVRETQAPTPDGGRDVSDTTYNTDGWVVKASRPYSTSGAPNGTLVQAQDGDIPAESGYTYDGAGRRTVSTEYALGTETWHTTTVYGGNFTTTIPPAGATAQSLLTDARGHITHMYDYHAGAPADPVNDPASDYADTSYTYYPDGSRASETDAAGNTWSWKYNLLGEVTSATDPDTGTGTTAFDNAGQVTSTTFVSPHFGFSANTPNLKQLARDFDKALKTHYDKEFDPRASTYKMPESTLSYGIEVGTWDDVCKAHQDLCSKSFASEVNGLHAALDKQAKANERGMMCIFMGQCHWWKVTAAATVFFRTMRAAPDGKPMLGTGSRHLGARLSDYEENLDEDGNIVTDKAGELPPGASLATDPRKLPLSFRPNWLPGGKSKDPLWAIKDDSALAARGVTPRPDSNPNKDYHILLGPSENRTSPEEYGAAMESTQDLWMNTNAESMEDVQAFLTEIEGMEE